jgi:glycosyltransferase involved in cell wall biosynthesis
MFTIVIPVIPKHFRYLRYLLKELISEEDLILEVLICASSVDIEHSKELDAIVADSYFNNSIRIFSTQDSRSAGENRNIGWNEAVSKYVAFLDADDIYHPRRLRTIIQVLNDYNGDALVHDYYRMRPRYCLTKCNTTTFKVCTGEELLFANKSRMDMKLPKGDIYFGETNLLLPARLANMSKVHHGHLVVKKEIPIRYSSRRSGEDGELIVELLKNNFNLVFISAKLSIYDRLNYSNMRDSCSGHLRVRLSKVFRIFFKPRSKR